MAEFDDEDNWCLVENLEIISDSDEWCLVEKKKHNCSNDIGSYSSTMVDSTNHVSLK
ncbi:hypothetical protein OROGR_017347 [Orobanche gracilis]